MSEKLTPNVRFAGFTDPWEQRKLGELSEIRRGASPRPIKSKKWFSDTSDVGWLRISDVTAQNGRITHVTQHLSAAGQAKTLVLNEPHLILSIAASVGKPVINYLRTGIHDGFIVFINPNFDIEFMFQWLLYYQNNWQKYGQPGSQVNLNSSLVKNTKVVLPKESEQARIRATLNKIDDIIASNQKQVEQLKTLKKLLLQKIFDQEWRFKGFTDPWEQRKLGDVADRVKSYSLSRNVETDAETFQKYIHYGDIHTRRAARITNLKQLPNIKNGKYIPLQYGDIAVADASEDYKEIAIPAILLANSQKIKVVAGLHTIAFRPQLNMNSEFIYHGLFTHSFKHYVYRVGQGLKVFGISSRHFFEYPLIFPNIGEQSKIVRLLNTVDNTIASNQKKVEQLKRMKKWLLQNMFA